MEADTDTQPENRGTNAAEPLVEKGGRRAVRNRRRSLSVHKTRSSARKK